MLRSTYSYVTYQDIRGIRSLKDQIVICIKAPQDTKLEVPNPEEVRREIIEGFCASKLEVHGVKIKLSVETMIMYETNKLYGRGVVTHPSRSVAINAGGLRLDF